MLASLLKQVVTQAEPGTDAAVGFPLPLYTEEWVDELMSRIFAILSNLETPTQPGENSDRVSFLLEGNSMFRRAGQPRIALQA